MLNDLPTSKGFPAGSRPLIYQEVIDQGVYTVTDSNQLYFFNNIALIIYFQAVNQSQQVNTLVTVVSRSSSTVGNCRMSSIRRLLSNICLTGVLDGE